MNSNNTVNATGYVVRDAHFLPATTGESSRQAVLYFSLGVTRMPSKRDESATDWPDFVIYGKRAEALQSLITQGKHVQVLGALRTRKDTDLLNKDGEPTSRVITQIAVEDISFLQKAPASEPSQASSNSESETELAF